MEMKKTMIFKTDESYDSWFNANVKKDKDLKFIENRVIARVVEESRVTNDFVAVALIECEEIETAVKRFCKELTSNGFTVTVDEFESILQDFKVGIEEGIETSTECDFEKNCEIELMKYNDGSFYVRYERFQDEIEKDDAEQK